MDDDDFDFDFEFEFDDYGIWVVAEKSGYCFTCGVLGRFRIFNRLVSWHLGRM